MNVAERQADMTPAGGAEGLAEFGDGFLREVFEYAPAGMFVVDGHARIMFANRALARMFANSVSNIVGKIGGEGLGCANAALAGCGEGRVCADCSLRGAIMQAMRNGARVTEASFTSRFAMPDGIREKSLLAHVSPLRLPRSSARYALVMVNDVSDLLERNAELERLAQAKDTLLRVIAHDLGSPMTGIFSAVETLLERIEIVPAATAREILRMVRDSLGRQLELLRRLLDYVRIHTDPSNVAIHPVAVGAAVQAVVETLLPAATAKEICVSVQTDGSGLFALADPELLTSVMVNLLNNAIKFTPQGGRVTVSIRSQDERVHVEVCDTGVGIEPARAQALMTTGVARSTRGTSGEAGAGLGMPFVVAILAAHGARLRIESQPGAGTTVSFDLPVAHMAQTSDKPASGRE